MALDADVDGYPAKELRLGPVTPVAVWRPRLTADLDHGQSVSGRFILEADEVQQLQQRNSMDMETLLQALVAPAAMLALPYLSSFYVGAVALGRSGRIYMGGNMEFPGATLASSVHAEQCLSANLLRSSERELVAVAISAPPCGHCRQFFSEMACADTMKLIFGQGPDNVYKLADILPHRFGPHDLLMNGNQPLLLQEQFHRLRFTSGAETVLERRKGDASFQKAAASALVAAQHSYSPYTKTPSAVALVTDKGVHSGGCVENAAHNPTLQPLQAAYASALFEGVADYSKVREAVLVELQDSPLRQHPSVQALLTAVAPKAFLTVLHVVYH